MNDETHVIIDDERTLGCDIIVRNPDKAKAVLRAQIATHLYIDHDLGIGLSGYDILKWGLENDCIPKFVQVVSMNPDGKKMMEALLRDYGYQLDSEGCFYQRMLVKVN